MELNDLFSDNAVSLFPLSDSENEDIDSDEQLSELDFIRQTIKNENLFPSLNWSNLPLSSSSSLSYSANVTSADSFPGVPISASISDDYVMSAVDPLGGLDYEPTTLSRPGHGNNGASPSRSPTLDFLYGEDGFFQAGADGHSSGSEGSSNTARRPGGSQNAYISHLNSSSSPYASLASSPTKSGSKIKKGGRKKGSSIQCDENLIMRLLPMSTKSFNQEIKNLDITQEEVKKLKFARRRIKNARAAQNRRSKLIGSVQVLQKKVDWLTRENGELQRRLTLALNENQTLKLTAATTNQTASTPNQRVLVPFPVRASENDHIPQLR